MSTVKNPYNVVINGEFTVDELLSLIPTIDNPYTLSEVYRGRKITELYDGLQTISIWEIHSELSMRLYRQWLGEGHYIVIMFDEGFILTLELAMQFLNTFIKAYNNNVSLNYSGYGPLVLKRDEFFFVESDKFHSSDLAILEHPYDNSPLEKYNKAPIQEWLDEHYPDEE